jgi:hypothetical protein
MKFGHRFATLSAGAWWDRDRLNYKMLKKALKQHAASLPQHEGGFIALILREIDKVRVPTDSPSFALLSSALLCPHLRQRRRRSAAVRPCASSLLLRGSPRAHLLTACNAPATRGLNARAPSARRSPLRLASPQANDAFVASEARQAETLERMLAAAAELRAAMVDLNSRHRFAPELCTRASVRSLALSPSERATSRGALALATFLEFVDEVASLRQFAMLNITAVEKILKKHDKSSPLSLRASVVAYVRRLPMSASPRLGAIWREVLALADYLYAQLGLATTAEAPADDSEDLRTKPPTWGTAVGRTGANGAGAVADALGGTTAGGDDAPAPISTVPHAMPLPAAAPLLARPVSAEEREVARTLAQAFNGRGDGGRADGGRNNGWNDGDSKPWLAQQQQQQQQYGAANAPTAGQIAIGSTAPGARPSLQQPARDRGRGGCLPFAPWPLAEAREVVASLEARAQLVQLARTEQQAPVLLVPTVLARLAPNGLQQRSGAPVSEAEAGAVLAARKLPSRAYGGDGGGGGGSVPGWAGGHGAVLALPSGIAAAYARPLLPPSEDDGSASGPPPLARLAPGYESGLEGARAPLLGVGLTIKPGGARKRACDKCHQGKVACEGYPCHRCHRLGSLCVYTVRVL